jgi:hypothetical protein
MATCTQVGGMYPSGADRQGGVLLNMDDGTVYTSAFKWPSASL